MAHEVVRQLAGLSVALGARNFGPRIRTSTLDSPTRCRRSPVPQKWPGSLLDRSSKRVSEILVLLLGSVALLASASTAAACLLGQPGKHRPQCVLHRTDRGRRRQLLHQGGSPKINTSPHICWAPSIDAPEQASLGSTDRKIATTFLLQDPFARLWRGEPCLSRRGLTVEALSINSHRGLGTF